MPANRGRVCARAISRALVFGCMTLPCLAVEAHAAQVPPGFYGVNSGWTLLSDAAARPAAFAAMRAGGLSFVRVQTLWDQLEPAPPVAGVHTFLWAKLDPFVADLARNGLRLYPMLSMSSPWGSSVLGDRSAPPAGNADFAAFVAAFAARYGSSGSFWAEQPGLPKLPTTVYGIWNEPSNADLWRGVEATPARYMSLYLAARAAIRSIDPSAVVATGGLLDSGVVDGNAYLRSMLDSVPAARNQIDAVGWHPYVGDVARVLASIKRARTTLDDYGLRHVPLEISEVGWPTDFAPAQRAAWLRGLAAQLPLAGMNVTRLMPFVWTGFPEWQITNPDGSPGLDGAYFAGIRDALLARATPTTKRKASRTCKARRRPSGKRKAARKCVFRARRTARHH